MNNQTVTAQSDKVSVEYLAEQEAEKLKALLARAFLPADAEALVDSFRKLALLEFAGVMGQVSGAGSGPKA